MMQKRSQSLWIDPNFQVVTSNHGQWPFHQLQEPFFCFSTFLILSHPSKMIINYPYIQLIIPWGNCIMLVVFGRCDEAKDGKRNEWQSSWPCGGWRSHEALWSQINVLKCFLYNSAESISYSTVLELWIELSKQEIEGGVKFTRTICLWWILTFSNWLHPVNWIQ